MGPREAIHSSGPQVPSLVARLERPLTLYTARLLGDAERARDIVQEAFLRLVRERPSEDEAQVRAWLYTVCRNLALDERRKERRMSALDSDQGPIAEPSPSELLERREEATTMIAALGTLPENQREVLRLKFQGGLSYREISAVTKLSLGNVGYLIHVGLKTLRERMVEGGSR